MHKIIELENGLKIVMEKIDGVNSVSVGVMIKNGSRNEEPRLNGISHFIEHMFFKGTETRTFNKITSEIENIGGQINAFTGKESTCYFVKVLGSHIEKGLDVLSDIILNSKFDKDEIEKEKGVVVEEINMSTDSPEEVLEDLHATISYKDSELSYPILGTEEKVRSFTREDIIEYIEEKYAPKNSVISICGKVDYEEIESLVRKYFSTWKNKKEYNHVYEEVEVSSGTGFIEKEIEQLHINISYRGLKYNHPKSYALVLVNNILGGGASSILFQKVREELGLCYSIYSYMDSYKECGGMNVYLGLNKNSATKALEVINEAVENFVQNGITEEALKINKEKIKGTFILGQESTSSKMFANGKSLLFRGKIRTEEEVLEKIDEITMEDVNFVIKECFRSGAVNTVYVGQKVNIEDLNSIIFKKNF
ncbi:pitrilysin family protein [uncultured Clostridium sp.]|uniref:M16 family metallopeptidase n=1 Tax=uncultured Clostridium sp. TaxID=59620 RepID=UPI0026164A7C|nr:pitrilysin family protein [uncultured Clostridium sp.]